MRKLLIISFILFHYLSALTNEQVRILNQCYQYGKQSNLGYTLAAICWVESQAGYWRINSESGDYGITGINLRTALNRLRLKPIYSNIKRLQTRLVMDNELALQLALSELEYWKYQRKYTEWFDYVSAYNRGHIGSYNYARKISRTIRWIKKMKIIKE
jgi:hypothetical protein